MDPLLVALFQTRIDPALDAGDVLDRLRADWGEILDAEYDHITASMASGSPGLGAETAVMSLFFDEVRVIVAAAAMPYDLDVAEAAEASPSWEPGRALPDPAGSSLLVMAMPVADDEAALERFLLDEERDVVEEAILISRVVTSLLACTDSVSAVYLSSSEQIVSPENYRRGALDVAPDLPLTMWVDFLVADEAGLVSGETLGLWDLGLFDIEITESTQSADEVVKILVDAAVLMYDEGPVIGDGDVLEGENGDFVVSVGPSKYDPEQPVLHLTPAVAANRAERRAAARKKRRH